MIKLIALLFINLLVFASCNNNQHILNETKVADTTATLKPTPSVKLVVEDPDAPPNKMYVAAYQNKEPLFKFNLPAGEITTNTDTFVQIQLTPQEGSSLQGITIQVSPGNCSTDKNMIDTTYTEPIKWTTLTVGNQTFNQGTTGLQGVSPNYTYSWQQNNTCISFVFELNTGVAFENEPPPPAFNRVHEEAVIKALLKTIILNSK